MIFKYLLIEMFCYKHDLVARLNGIMHLQEYHFFFFC